MFSLPCDAEDLAMIDSRQECHQLKKLCSQSHYLEEKSPVISIPDFWLHRNTKKVILIGADPFYTFEFLCPSI